MRYGTEHKEQTRQKVLNEAAAAIRSVGPGGIGVAGLMAKAGLTHGGFYAHFKSKDDLLGQAVGQMFDESYDRFFKWTSQPDAVVSLDKFIDRYVSVAHRDFPERGCPLPALTSDFARMPEEARERFAAGLDRFTMALAKLLEKLDKPNTEPLAASMISEMVGAVSLARAVGDTASSNRMLKASREALKTRIGLPIA